MRFSFTKAEYNFILFLPILGAISTVLTDYFQTGSLNIGQIRAFILLIYSFYFISKGRLVLHSLSNLLLVLLFYLFILSFLSTDFMVSFQLYLKFYIATFFFFIGYYFSVNPNFLKDLIKPLLICLFIYIINFMISNIFNLGFQSYSEVQNKLYFGVSGVNLAKHIVVILIIYPIIGLFKLNKFWSILSRVLFFGGIIFILFAFKRSAILSLFFGFFTYFLVVRDLKSVRKFLVFIFFLSIISPLIIDQVKDNFAARSESIFLNDQSNLENQARYSEFYEVIDYIREGGIEVLIFGSNLFNTMELFKTERMLHTDYMTILSGSGIIGLFLFILFYFLLYRKSRIKYFKQLPKYYITFHGVTCALILALIILGFSGNIQAIEPRGLTFLFLGALYGSKRHRTFSL